MNPGAAADRVLLAHMRDCLDRIAEYAHAERTRFDASRLVQDAVIRNLQALAELPASWQPERHEACAVSATTLARRHASGSGWRMAF